MATQKLTYWPSVLSYSVKAGFSVSSLAYAGLFFGILEDKTSGYLGCRRYHKCSVEQFFKIYLFFMFMSALSSCTAL